MGVASNVDQKAQPKYKQYQPSEIERLIHSKYGSKGKKIKGRRNHPRVGSEAGEIILQVGKKFSVDEFPKLPEFNLSIQGKCW